MQQNESTASYGYLYHTDSRDAGCHQFDVTLTEHPTRQHFDPVDLRVPALRSSGVIKYIHIRHHWDGEPMVVLAIGRIILTDWRNKIIEAFSFGGDLRVEDSLYWTRCTLISDAPIILLKDVSIGRLDADFDTRLVERAEGLIARTRSASGHRIADFEEQLTSQPPRALYCATVAALEAEMEAHTPVNQEMMSFLCHLHEVHHQLAELHDWVEPPLMFRRSR